MSSSEPSYQVEATDRYTLVTLPATLSKEQWGNIEEAGNGIVARLNDVKTRALLVDLSAMEYIGSSTVALMVRLWKTIQKNDKDDAQMAVIVKHPVVLEVLQIAGLTKVWTVVGSRDEAVSELGVGQRGPGVAMIVAGLIVAAIAVAGLVIQLSSNVNVRREVALVLLFGGAAAGLILGTLNAYREEGYRRVVSVLSLLACLTVGIVGIVKLSG